MGVCTKERNGRTAAVLMATPCTNSLGESGGHDRSMKSLSLHLLITLHSPALFFCEGRGRSDGHAAEEDWLVRAH